MLDKGYVALNPVAPQGLIFEAIGDSITAGFKVTGSPMASTEDVFKTYSYHLAKHWGADDWNVVARSGIGVIERADEHEYLKQYNCANFQWDLPCQLPWDFSKRVPDVVTVNLGTNDYTFVTPLPSQQTFATKYSELLSAIRGHYPQATIFAIVPIIYSCVGGKFATMRNGILAAVEEQNDPRIHVIETGSPSDQWLSCGSEFSDYTHPTVAGHKKFAERLAEKIDPLLPTASMMLV